MRLAPSRHLSAHARNILDSRLADRQVSRVYHHLVRAWDRPRASPRGPRGRPRLRGAQLLLQYARRARRRATPPPPRRPLRRLVATQRRQCSQFCASAMKAPRLLLSRFTCYIFLLFCATASLLWSRFRNAAIETFNSLLGEDPLFWH